MSTDLQPIPYPDVNSTLQKLLSEARSVLGDYFAGLYLYGSLASGDFDPESSDIDFVVVTKGKLPDEMVSALEAMHAELASTGLKWAAKLEGSYIPQETLRRYNPTDGPFPQINEGRFYLAGHGSDWLIQRHIMRENEVIVAGPSLQSLIDPVEPADLQRAVRGILQEWWSPMLQDSGWLRGSAYQVFAVLTMCRALYTLQHGIVASKPASVRWAQESLAEEWATLIAEAANWRHGAQFERLEEVVAFIHYTGECAKA
jgi:predicted nucleotidyltransferase